MKRPAVFFDRDNTLIISDGYLGDPDGVVLVPGAAEVVARVKRLGFIAVVFSNQSGVARGLFTEEDVHRVNARLDEMLCDQAPGAVIDRHEFCPHHPEALVPRYRQASEFRKPAPGMIYQAARQLELDLERSWVVGDAPRDIEAGRSAGCRTILVKDPGLPASPAAVEPQRVEPDFVVSSLREIVETIERNQPVEPAPEAAAEVQVEAPPVEPADQARPTVTASEWAEPEVEPESAADVAASAPAADAAEPQAQWASEVSPEATAAHAAEKSAASEPVAAPTPEAVVPPEPVMVRAEPLPDHAPTSQAASASEALPAEPSAPASASPAASADSEPSKRRAIPAVILAAKAAREAAKQSSPQASPEALREAARQAAREAAHGEAHDHESPVVASEPPLVALAVDSEPQPGVEPAAETPPEPVRESMKAARRSTPLPAQPIEEPGPPPPGRPGRLEDLVEQILIELKQRNDAISDFSVTKLLAGILQVISVAVLAYAYLYRDTPMALMNVLLLGIMLQTLTIALLIMGKQR